MRINRLDHVALTVADRAASVDFYSRVLGMTAVTADNGEVTMTFAHGSIELRVAGQELGGFRIAESGGPPAELCFVVEEPVMLLIDKVKAMGLRTVGPRTDPRPHGDMGWISVCDPDGNVIVLANYLD